MTCRLPLVLPLALPVLLAALLVATPSAGQTLPAAPPDTAGTARRDTARYDTARYDTVRYDAGPLDVRALPDAALAPYRDDPAYRYHTAEAPETWWDRFWSWLGETLLAPLASPGLAPARRWLFYALVALVLGYALLRLLRMDAGGVFYARRSPARVGAGAAEEDLGAEDLDRLVAEAVAAHDYRRAVRLSYLRLLKHLSAEGLIAWRPEKTNHDYLAELGTSPLHRPFAHLTTLFEYAWYGDFPVDAALYARVRDDAEEIVHHARRA